MCLRIHRIVRDLHAFSRVDDDPSGATDVNAAVESALTMLRNELRYRAEVSRSLEASRLVLGSSARIGQVFLNLIHNAAQSIAPGDVEQNRIAVSSREDAGNVIIEVSDTGCGISSSDRERIFDMFYTTKPVGVGTGLGLAIVARIVRDHGGSLSVEDAAGRGGRFTFTLPLAADPVCS